MRPPSAPHPWKKGGDGLTRLSAAVLRLHAPARAATSQPIHGGSMKYKFAALAAAFAGMTLLGAAPSYADEEEDARARADVRAQIGETDPDYGPSFSWRGKLFPTRRRSSTAAPAARPATHRLHYARPRAGSSSAPPPAEASPSGVSSAGCSAAACARSSPTAGRTTAPRRSPRRARRRGAPASPSCRSSASTATAPTTAAGMPTRASSTWCCASSPPAPRPDRTAAWASSISTTAPTPTGPPPGG